jgi:hypothetical protein
MKVNTLDNSNIELGNFISSKHETDDCKLALYYGLAKIVVKFNKINKRIDLKSIDGIKIINEIVYGINELSPIDVDLVKANIEKILTFEKYIVNDTSIAFNGNSFLEDLGVYEIFGENLINIVNNNIETIRILNFRILDSEFYKTLASKI